MASGDDDSEDRTGGTHEPRECMACRGTGRVISNLGGTPARSTCPWCAGTGMRNPEIDAQAGWPVRMPRQRRRSLRADAAGDRRS